MAATNATNYIKLLYIIFSEVTSYLNKLKRHKKTMGCLAGPRFSEGRLDSNQLVTLLWPRMASQKRFEFEALRWTLATLSVRFGQHIANCETSPMIKIARLRLIVLSKAMNLCIPMLRFFVPWVDRLFNWTKTKSMDLKLIPRGNTMY